MHSKNTPDIDDIERIASLIDPIIRNLQITQCYYELSCTLSDRISPGANWCTFATWASKQAGQTIRKEDINRALETALNSMPSAEQTILKIISSVMNIGAKQNDENIRKSIWNTLTFGTVDRSSNSVAIGNNKVFKEIGREFAHFIHFCLHDETFNPDKIQDFCTGLQEGPPPDGQQYLRKAFTRYYQSLYESDGKKRAELILLANLEIGFHEQTRLQPEIAASLNAALIDPKDFRKQLLAAVFPSSGWLAKIRFFFLWLFGKLSQLDSAIESLIDITQQHIRLVITGHLMSISFPPDLHIQLGKDLTIGFPDSLKEIKSPDLKVMLNQIDPAPDSLSESGAKDWADLNDRIHFIADLFRCYQESVNLFDAPFSPEQVSALKAGNVPGGRI